MRFAKACLAWLAALLVILTAAGCGRTSGPEADAVSGYLAGLPPALHAETLNGLRPYATGEEVDRVQRYVGMVLNEGSRMEATVDTVSIKDIETDGSASTVRTEEDWTVRYRDATTGGLQRTESYRLKVRYHLVLAGGTWLVAEVEELDRAVE